MNKYWAVFDKDGGIEHVSTGVELACWYEFKSQCSFRLCNLAIDKFIDEMQREGYTCKQVVVLPVEEYEKLNGLASLVSGAKAGKPIAC
jgi:hypothetical protein